MQLTLDAYLLPHLFYTLMTTSSAINSDCYLSKLGISWNYLDAHFLLLCSTTSQQVAPEILAAHTAWVKGSKEITGLMLMTMDSEIQRNLENLHAYDMLQELKTLFAQQAEQELLQTTRDFHSCKQEEGQSVSSYVLKMKGYIDNLERLGHPTINDLHDMLKLHEQTLTLPKNNDPALHAIRAGKVQKGHWKRNCPQYVAELLKKKKNAASRAGGSGIFGLRASRKLKPGALSLYVGNGQREAIEAIGIFYLCLSNGLEIVLNNCHYAPSINRGVISVSHLDGIFEINLSNSYANESSIYTVSNKRTKLDLDAALLWHCHLGHISKKRIEKLQHDGLLNSTDLRAFEKRIPCMSRKMAWKPYTH
ncbi:zinc finger, CCHC-type containing protein [Tanacetum coccineum]